MADTTENVDPWSTKGLPFTRTWPLYVGVALGVVVAVAWLLLDRPSISFLSILVIGGGVAGGIAAAFAPAGERSARFLDVAYPGLLAGVSSEFFGAIGVLATGKDEGGEAVNTTFVYFFVMLFFVGFPLLIANLFQSPKRRLPEDVLAQIGEPYPTRREPRQVTVEAADGTTHRVSVLRGGYLAGIGLAFDPTEVTGIASDKVVPSGPKQVRVTRAEARDRVQATARARRKAKADAKAGTADDTADAGRATPAPTSRTTPKGTPNKPRGKK